jgi:hypothetical protein
MSNLLSCCPQGVLLCDECNRFGAHVLNFGRVPAPMPVVLREPHGDKTAEPALAQAATISN